MSTTISFTIPMDADVLRKTSDMLLSLAGDAVEEPTVTPLGDANEPNDIIVTLPPPLPPADTDSAIELDSEGFPWDGRIHSSAKTKVQRTGEWKLIRGKDPTVVEAIKQELSGGCGTLPPTPPLPPSPATATAEYEATVTGYARLATRILELKKTGSLTDYDINGIANSVGVTSLTELVTSLDKIPSMGKAIEAFATL